MEHPPRFGIGMDYGWFLDKFFGTASQRVRALINLGFSGPHK
jgi:F0F1-type ATP synthase assembly protein I